VIYKEKTYGSGMNKKGYRKVSLARPSISHANGVKSLALTNASLKTLIPKTLKKDGKQADVKDKDLTLKAGD